MKTFSAFGRVWKAHIVVIQGILASIAGFVTLHFFDILEYVHNHPDAIKSLDLPPAWMKWGGFIVSLILAITSSSHKDRRDDSIGQPEIGNRAGDEKLTDGPT